MDINLRGPVYEISFRYRPAIVDRIKLIEGKRYHPEKKMWTVPASQRVALERMVYQIQQFEKINWGGMQSETNLDDDIAYDVPELPTLQIPHKLKIEPYPYQFTRHCPGIGTETLYKRGPTGVGEDFAVYSYNQPCQCISLPGYLSGSS
jgi:SWI/SNF-related matrix-associated actin-dependent regulator 1 of chromatin subfamily A